MPVCPRRETEKKKKGGGKEEHLGRGKKGFWEEESPGSRQEAFDGRCSFLEVGIANDCLGMADRGKHFRKGRSRDGLEKKDRT